MPYCVHYVNIVNVKALGGGSDSVKTKVGFCPPAGAGPPAAVNTENPARAEPPLS